MSPAPRHGSMLTSLGVLSAGQVLSQLANMAALVYLADRLGAHWFGVVQVGVAVMSYALIAAEWGLMSLGIREVARLDEPAAIRRYIREHTGLLALQAVAVLAVGLVILPRLPFYANAPWVYVLYLAAVLPQVYTQTWAAVGLEWMVPVGVSRVVRSLVYALLVLGALRLLGPGEDARSATWVPAMFLAAIAVSNLVVNIPLARRFGGFMHPARPAAAEARRRWRETASIGVNTIVLRVLLNVDIMLLGILAAPEMVGNYAAAARLVFLLVVAVEVLWAALLPRLSRLARTSREAFVTTFNLYLGLVAAALAPFALGGALVGPDLVAFLYRGKFPEAGPVFARLAVAYAMLSLAMFLGNTLLAEDRQARYMAPLACGSLAAVAGVMLLLPRGGVAGAALGMLLAYALLLVVLVAVNLRNMRMALLGLVAGIAPALVALAATVLALDGRHVLLRIAAGAAAYLLLGAWPILRFQGRLRARLRTPAPEAA
jgi:O-antigen/teichoic acid export membrane protein